MVDRRQGRVVAVYLLTVMRRWTSSWTRHRLDQPAVSERAAMRRSTSYDTIRDASLTCARKPT